MRVAVVSDIHSNLTALNQIMMQLEEESIDEYLFLGDYITDGFQDDEVISLVKKYATHAISGNRDRMISLKGESAPNLNSMPLYWSMNHLSDESINYIETLPRHKFIDYGKHRILIIHGDAPLINAPFKDSFEALMKLGDFDVCLFGHVHATFDKEYKGRRFINVGSAGIPEDGPEYKYLILNIDEEIKPEFKQISTQEAYEKLTQAYRVSKYYEDNPIWGEIILDAIKHGRNAREIYFGIIEELLKSDVGYDFETAWEAAFSIWRESVMEV